MDKRTPFEKKLDERLGMPLYYCSCCMRAVKVTPIEGQEPVVERPCDTDCDGATIIAPRKAIAVGEGGMNFIDRVKFGYWQLGAALTGRCV